VVVRLDRRLRVDPALAAEIPEQFLLLCVDADHRQSSLQVLLPQAGDLLELRVTIAMMAHGLLLLCLPPAVAVLPEQLGHYVGAHRPLDLNRVGVHAILLVYHSVSPAG
jgi:hypothetical protein